MSLPAPVLDAMPETGPLVDRFGRVHTYVRVSVTDRCNYRCTYCVDETAGPVRPREELLSFEEIVRVVRALKGLGIRRIRLTGGEPLVRRGIVHLVRMLADLGLDDLSMTTNGHLLQANAERLAAAGLHRVNVSLDAIDAPTFARMAGVDALARVLDGVEAARRAGLTPVKVNAVLIRGDNDDQVLPLLQAFSAWPDDVQVRYLEHMPFGTTVRDHVAGASARATLAAHHTLEPLGRGEGGPAEAWRVAETGQIVGFVSPLTEHFCHACNRLRVTADGHLRTCLSRDDAPSLRALLRGGASDDALAQAIRRQVWAKVAGHEATADGGRAFEGVMTRIGG